MLAEASVKCTGASISSSSLIIDQQHKRFSESCAEMSCAECSICPYNFSVHLFGPFELKPDNRLLKVVGCA